MRVRGPGPPIQDWPEVKDITVSHRAELDILFTAAYQELHRLAGSIRRSTPNAPLSPTTLVNEAWLKLAAAQSLAWESPLHFKRIAARAMRQLLMSASRKSRAAKRQNGAGMTVTFHEELPVSAPDRCAAGDVLRLDEALDQLARLNPRQASIVESRFFGGMEISETALVLGVSEATVARDWRMAKAWLGRELRGDARDGRSAV